MKDNKTVIVAIISILVLIYFYISYYEEEYNYKNIYNKIYNYFTDDNIENLDNLDNSVKNNDLTIYFIYSNGCVYCDKMKPIYEKIKEEYKNKRVNFIKLDKNNPKTSEFYIQGYPYFYFKSNKKSFSKLGAFSEDQFKEIIDNLLYL